MATWQHKSRLSQPDGDPWGGIVATFGDGSSITMVSRGSTRDPDLDSGPRQTYAYSINQPEVPRTVDANMVRSGCGDPLSYLRALSTLCSFLGADAEHYARHYGAQCCGQSLALLAWADEHADELALLQDELDQECNPQ